MTSVCIFFTKPPNIFLQKCKAIAMKLFSQRKTAMYSERRQMKKKMIKHNTGHKWTYFHVKRSELRIIHSGSTKIYDSMLGL